LVNGRFVTIDPRFSGFSLFQNLGYIDYNALQSRAEYRGAKLRAGGSYTLAKTFSNTLATGVGGGAATNPLDLSIDEGPASAERAEPFCPAFSAFSAVSAFRSMPMKGTVRSAIAVFLLVMPAIAQQQRTPPPAAPAGAIAIRAGRLIDPEAGTASTNQTIVV